MICVIGLGNRGLKYRNTRHNAGFRVIDLLAGQYGIKMKNTKFEAKAGQGMTDGKKILLVKPQTYMNASGYAVDAVLDYYNIPMKDLIVLVDDMELPLGSIRIRDKGSAGGHNGLKSIISYLKSENFTRVRIGIGKPDGQKGVVPHVLGKFGRDEAGVAAETFERCAQAVDCLVREGLQAAQSRYNA